MRMFHLWTLLIVSKARLVTQHVSRRRCAVADQYRGLSTAVLHGLCANFTCADEQNFYDGTMRLICRPSAWL